MFAIVASQHQHQVVEHHQPVNNLAETHGEVFSWLYVCKNLDQCAMIFLYCLCTMIILCSGKDETVTDQLLFHLQLLYCYS